MEKYEFYLADFKAINELLTISVYHQQAEKKRDESY